VFVGDQKSDQNHTQFCSNGRIDENLLFDLSTGKTTPHIGGENGERGAIGRRKKQPNLFRSATG